MINNIIVRVLTENKFLNKNIEIFNEVIQLYEKDQLIYIRTKEQKEKYAG